MRAARKKLENTPLRRIDDLTREDMAAKQRVRPFMEELYGKTGDRLSGMGGSTL